MAKASLACAFEIDDDLRITNVIHSLTLNHPNFTSADPALAALARAIFFPNSRSILGLLSPVHPFLANFSLNHTTKQGLRAIIEALSTAKTRSTSTNTLIVDQIPGSVIILGGPEYNLYSTLIFGAGETSPLLRASLPVMFRYVSARKKNEQNGWSVTVAGREQKTECLVITSLPMGQGRRFVNFAGWHASGTRAVSLLFKSRKWLTALGEQAEGLKAWQGLIGISASADVPTKIYSVKVFPVSVANIDHIVAKDLILTDERIAELMALMRSRKYLQLSNPEIEDLLGNVLRLPQRDLTISKMYEKVPKELYFRESASGGPLGATGAAGGPFPPALRERQMDTRSDTPTGTSARRHLRRGRPRQKDRSLIKGRRFELRLAEDDIERLERLIQRMNASSAAEVVRLALASYEERLGKEHQSRETAA